MALLDIQTDRRAEGGGTVECTKVNCPMQAGTKTDNCGENCPWRTTAKTGDLISRATAIERIDKCVALSGIGCEPVMAIRDIKALISVLPAVDAIPVEWLNEKFMDLQNKDKAPSRAAWLVLHAWQREQGGRDSG